jgi:hypothetical protein
MNMSSQATRTKLQAVLLIFGLLCIVTFVRLLRLAIEDLHGLPTSIVQVLALQTSCIGCGTLEYLVLLSVIFNGISINRLVLYFSLFAGLPGVVLLFNICVS